MTAITVDQKFEGWNGEIKTLILKDVSTPSSSYTYDTNMDATNGRGAEFREIFDAKITSSTGSYHVDCTFSNSTGIVTLGTIGAAIQTGYLRIKGR